MMYEYQITFTDLMAELRAGQPIHEARAAVLASVLETAIASAERKLHWVDQTLPSDLEHCPAPDLIGGIAVLTRAQWMLAARTT